MDRSKDRRKFLKLLLTGSALAATPGVAAGASGLVDDKGKVKLLTEDGKLVEIDKDVLDKLRSGKKAASDDIRQFIHPDKK